MGVILALHAECHQRSCRELTTVKLVIYAGLGGKRHDARGGRDKPFRCVIPVSFPIASWAGTAIQFWAWYIVRKDIVHVGHGLI